MAQLTGNSERVQRMPFPYEILLLVPLLVEPYQNFIFVWRFLARFTRCDNSTIDHLLTGWGKWKRSPADSVWQAHSRPGEAVRFPAGGGRESALRAAGRGAASRAGAARCPAGKGSAGPAEVPAFRLAAQVEPEAKK